MIDGKVCTALSDPAIFCSICCLWNKTFWNKQHQ